MTRDVVRAPVRCELFNALLLPPALPLENILRSAAVRLSIVAPINLMLSILWKFIVCCPPNLTLSCSLLAVYGCMKNSWQPCLFSSCCLDSKEIIQMRIQFDFFFKAVNSIDTLLKLPLKQYLFNTNTSYKYSRKILHWKLGCNSNKHVQWINVNKCGK